MSIVRASVCSIKSNQIGLKWLHPLLLHGFCSAVFSTKNLLLGPGAVLLATLLALVVYMSLDTVLGG